MPYDLSFRTVAQKLPTGDYTIEGMEDYITVDRKRSTGEISQCFGVEKKRFYKELERMREFELAILLFEFSVEDVLNFPLNSGIPPKYHYKIQMKPKFLLKCINECITDYGIHVLYCGNRDNAIITLESLFKRVNNYRFTRSKDP